MKKKKALLICSVLLLVAVSISLVACSGGNYIKEVTSYKFWDNTLEKAVPQTAIAHMVGDHLSDTNGKTKKVAVLGFDGMRADGLTAVIASGVINEKTKLDEYSGKFYDAMYSGINTVRTDGGKVYMAYAGGEKGTETQQHTSTAPGWSALTSGVWGNLNGVTNNGETMIKNLDYKTFMLKAAEGAYGGKTYKSTFYGSWNDHYKYQYKAEIDYLEENKSIPMVYKKFNNDRETYSAMKEAVIYGSPTETDVLFGIIELTDYNGHSTNFGRQNPKYTTAVRAADNYFYDIIQTIKSRESYDSEDWLIIFSTDHGGKGLSHGGQSAEERITFIVSNKDIDSKYQSVNFNGFVDKK